MQFKEFRGPLQAHTPCDTTGNAASTGSLPGWRAPYDCTVTAVSITPTAAVTADATNFATMTLTRHRAGASATTVATRVWNVPTTGDSAAHTPEAMTLSATAANLDLVAGDTLTLIKTVAASGLVIPSLLLVVTYKLTGV